MFIAVLFAGCVVCPRSRIKEAFGSTSREDLSSHLYKHAVSATRLSNFPRTPSLHSLTAYLILNTTWLREEQPLTCGSVVGAAARVSQMLGLHKEPSKFPNISPVDGHVRRQMWWSLISLGTQVAFASGLPPIIESRFYDVYPFSGLGEAAIDTGLSDNHSQGNATAEILRILVWRQIRFLQERRRSSAPVA